MTHPEGSAAQCPGYDWRHGDPRRCLQLSGHRGFCNGDTLAASDDATDLDATREVEGD